MSKSRKILFLILCILILTILIPVLLDFHKVSGLGLQLFTWKLFTWKQIPFVGYYLSRYVFWGTVVLASLILLLMLVIVFYPKRRLEIQLADADGKLMLKNSAIEGFVRCLLDEHKMVKNPKIQVHTRKKKCFVYVEGTAVLSDNIANKFEVVQNEITQGLKEFFGIDREVKLEVSVKEYDPQKAAKKIVSRVK